jgi:CHAT domain-containing protein
VLSACGSAAGAAQPGEGVAGIVWPLFARGVPQVIATLWNVRDIDATALTKAFYRHLHAGTPPLQALRRTQLEILSANRRAQNRSFGWAAFQLYGSLATGGME